MSQPNWKLIDRSDAWAVFEDETGVYTPECTYLDEIGESGEGVMRFERYRFSLDRLKRYEDPDDGTVYIVPEGYDETWPYAPSQYGEWFMDDLAAVGASVGRTRKDLIDDLCSEDPMRHLNAYLDIGLYHGFVNLDSYPEVIETQDPDAYLEGK